MYTRYRQITTSHQCEHKGGNDDERGNKVGQVRGQLIGRILRNGKKCQWDLVVTQARFGHALDNQLRTL
jgi:hypothetical protein